jgi:beta-aspartyl-peptidase (threonine type)
MSGQQPAVFVHGGVSGTRKDRQDLSPAVRAGLAVDTALDAVQAAVVTLEDDPVLNAGYGSVLCRDGTLELDAGIADGSSRRCGGTANVHVKNPVILARAVMDQTPHALLTGQGASAFAAALGLPILQDTTPEQRSRYERAQKDGSLDLERYGTPQHVDTVGAVAMGLDGRLASASSTGGVFGKLPGRVGDAPVFGAGFYASSNIAVVGTGVGEEFISTLACYRVAERLFLGDSPQSACEWVVNEIGKRAPDSTAGLLAIDAQGNVGAAYKGASWSVQGPDGPIEATAVS